MAVKQKWYAVRVGRDGPGIYDNWKETERAVKNFPKAQHKSFPTREQAQKYLDDHIPTKDTKVPEAEVLKRIHQHGSVAPKKKKRKKKRKDS
jgi:viroplasmin and RNaseH domain-containing protein